MPPALIIGLKSLPVGFLKSVGDDTQPFLSSSSPSPKKAAECELELHIYK